MVLCYFEFYRTAIVLNFALIRKFNEKREKRNKVCKNFRRKSDKMTVRNER